MVITSFHVTSSHHQSCQSSHRYSFQLTLTHTNSERYSQDPTTRIIAFHSRVSHAQEDNTKSNQIKSLHSNIRIESDPFRTHLV